MCEFCCVVLGFIIVAFLAGFICELFNIFLAKINQQPTIFGYAWPSWDYENEVNRLTMLEETKRSRAQLLDLPGSGSYNDPERIGTRKLAAPQRKIGTDNTC